MDKMNELKKEDFLSEELYQCEILRRKKEIQDIENKIIMYL